MRTAHLLVAGQELEGGPKVTEARGLEDVRALHRHGRRRPAEPRRGQRPRPARRVHRPARRPRREPALRRGHELPRRLHRRRRAALRHRHRGGQASGWSASTKWTGARATARSHENDDVQALYERAARQAARRSQPPPAAPYLRRPQRRRRGRLRRTADRRDHERNDHHDHQAELPPLLHLRARLPGQGDPHRGRPGLRGRRALHRLRQLHPGLLAERQGVPERAGAGDLAARARTPRWPRCWRRPSRRASTRRAGQLVGAFGRPGFDYVVEVAQGADLVSRRYREYLAGQPDGRAHRHRLPGRGRVRAQVPPRAGRPAWCRSSAR